MKDFTERIIHIFPEKQPVWPEKSRESQGKYKKVECRIPHDLRGLTNAEILRLTRKARPDTPGELAVRDYFAGRKLLIIDIP